MNAAGTIRQKIGAGLLPCEPCPVVWAGYGTGRPCAACDRAIAAEDVEYECGRSDGSVVRFHYECYRLWEAVCREVASGGVVP